MPGFTCVACGREFTVTDAALAKFPGWSPKRCLNCKQARSKPESPRGGARAARPSGISREENLTTAEVLAKYTAGPVDGVFADGAAEPNPGPGGWGTVYVVGNAVVTEQCGHEPHTTNNRMELMALISGTALVPAGTRVTFYTDSNLCVKTINEWAKGWEARGWKRKGGEIKNLDLVQELYGIFRRRPELSLQWIAAHAGNRWNEYADSLATAYRRKVR